VERGSVWRGCVEREVCGCGEGGVWMWRGRCVESGEGGVWNRRCIDVEREVCGEVEREVCEECGEGECGEGVWRGRCVDVEREVCGEW